jgi:hypothetical protein
MTTPTDRDILRRLAERQAEIAALPIHPQTVAGWKRLNDLKPGKPMIHIYQVCWHEMDVDGALTLQCQDPFNRAAEGQLRRTIYQWEHCRGDMVVTAEFGSPPVVRDTGFGLEVEEEIVRTDPRGGVVSHRFHPQIKTAADAEKIWPPQVICDREATERNHARLNELFGDLLAIRSYGVNLEAYSQGYAPWDWLVRWWGVQEALTDLVEKPQLAHLAMERLTQAVLARLDQYEALGLLNPNQGVVTGNGGLGYTDDLPTTRVIASGAPYGVRGAERSNPAPGDGLSLRASFAKQSPAPGGDCFVANDAPRNDNLRVADIWGGAMSQIFSGVSPRMHEEFALQYEARFLNRFGLCYYGCCEPLDLKVGILRRNLPRLRKISMSPWVNIERGAKAIGADYVFSRKPNPAFLATDVWHPEDVRADLTDLLEKTRGCHVEIILKDISTVRNQPHRLWEWAEIARQVTEEYAQ